MEHIISPAGIRLSYETDGSGWPLVLVHGSFSDHHTNWAAARPLLREKFTTYAVARRGRGETDATQGHSVEDEAADVAALNKTIDRPAFLLGHSYGAQMALAVAAQVPQHVRKLVLYEPPFPDTVSEKGLSCLEELGRSGRWDAFAMTFFHDELRVPLEELEALRGTSAWAEIVADARASLGDIRAMCGYAFDAGRFRDLGLPVLLQFGTESRRENFATDILAATLPEAQVEALLGQAHEAMQTAPELYVESVTRFLLP